MFSVDFVCPSVSRVSKPKLHKTLAVKDIVIQVKLILRLTFAWVSVNQLPDNSALKRYHTDGVLVERSKFPSGQTQKFNSTLRVSSKNEEVVFFGLFFVLDF